MATFQVDTVTINPNPPAAHTNNSVTGQGTLSAEIPAGSTFNVQAYFSGIRLLSQSGSVCKNSSISLPLGLGTIYVVGLNCPVVRIAANVLSVVDTIPDRAVILSPLAR